MKSDISYRNLVIDILTEAFHDNQSVRYAIKSGGDSKKKIEALMNYAYDMCNKYGEVILNEKKNACLLYIDSTRKKTTLRTIYWEIKLVLNAVGVFGIRKLLERETRIHQKHPDSPFLYLWFIGVRLEAQGQGNGSALLHSLLEKVQKPVHLETSNLWNIPFYTKAGFEIYDELDFGYRLLFLRKRDVDGTSLQRTSI